MAPKTFAGLFRVPELNRHLGQCIGADNEGLCQQARLCLTSRSLADRHLGLSSVNPSGRAGGDLMQDRLPERYGFFGAGLFDFCC